MDVGSLRDQILIGLRAALHDGHALEETSVLFQNPDAFSEAFALFCVEEMVFKHAATC
jgi:hypothetical protein